MGGDVRSSSGPLRKIKFNVRSITITRTTLANVIIIIKSNKQWVGGIAKQSR